MDIACGMDIGTNSFRLLVAEIKDGRPHPLTHDRITVRLGEELGSSGLIGPAAMLRGEAALVRLAGKLASYSLQSLRVCATHAVRKASNKQDFLRMAERTTGVSIEVLSGEEEGRLVLQGTLSALPEELRRYPLVLLDVGGGSTEIIFQEKAESDSQVISLGLGAIGLTEEFGENLAAMGEKIRATLAPALGNTCAREMVGQTSLLIASGGTATTLAALALGLDRYDGLRVQNYPLSQDALHRLLAELSTCPAGERDNLACLGNGRGKIIMAGAMILQEVHKALAFPDLLVSDAGLLEGILLSGAMGC
jgi:exopolyphosphatase/guanosine-5'-triphosphate,3'-diphosphate pyrophosphatase